VDSEVRLLSRLEAAKALRIGKSNLSELINEGRLGFISIGKRIFIPFKEIQQFIDTNTVRITKDHKDNSSKDESLSSSQFFNSLINNN
jgi:excisionase family DNA binding protein